MIASQDWEQIQRFVQTALDQGSRGAIPVPSWRPGSLTGSVDVGGIGAVLCDGDTAEITAINAAGVSLGTGTRVLVRFDPAGAVWIDAALGNTGISPPGMISAYGATTAPPGWLLCDGSAVSRSTYALLFAAVSTSFGTGDGSTTFNVPDLRGRGWVGLDNLGGSDAGILSVANTLGGTGGTQTHVLSSAEMPSHTHTQNAHNHSEVRQDGGASANFGADYIVGALQTTVTGNTTATNQNTGGGSAHNNMQPYMLGGWIIKT